MTHLHDIPIMCEIAARLMQPGPRPARLDPETGTRGRASCLAEWDTARPRIDRCALFGHGPALDLYHVGRVCLRCGRKLGAAAVQSAA